MSSPQLLQLKESIMTNFLVSFWFFKPMTSWTSKVLAYAMTLVCLFLVLPFIWNVWAVPSFLTDKPWYTVGMYIFHFSWFVASLIAKFMQGASAASDHWSDIDFD